MLVDDFGGRPDLPLELFFPMPSLSMTSSAHCMCRSSAGSARRTSLIEGGRWMGRVSRDVVVMLAVEDDAGFASGGMVMKRKLTQKRMCLAVWG